MLSQPARQGAHGAEDDVRPAEAQVSVQTSTHGSQKAWVRLKVATKHEERVCWGKKCMVFGPVFDNAASEYGSGGARAARGTRLLTYVPAEASI
jgi:hypothetical protein